MAGAVEEFLSQAKSTLDVAVQIFKPVFGINLRTFVHSGDQVVKALERQVPKEKAEHSERLIELIKGNRPWMEALRKYRDDTQHFSNIKLVPMRVSKDGDNYVYQPPLMAIGQDLRI